MVTSYEEIIGFFAEKFGKHPPEETILAGEVEVAVNQTPILLCKTEEGALRFESVLGFFEQESTLSQLQELLRANFLGIKTGGAVFFLDEHARFLQLRFTCCTTNSKAQHLEDFERFYAVTSEWQKKTSFWPEFSPFMEGKNQ